jgi:SAM-dependent methyltransferase
LLDAGHAPTGLDFSPAMLALCSRRARPIPLVEASFWDPLPFARSAFEAVIALHGTLAHPPNEGAIERLSAEIRRVLVPDGVLVIEAPSPAWLDDVAGDTEGRRVTRVDASSCRYEDGVVGVSIEARFFDEPRWRQLLSPFFRVRIEPLGGSELFIVATAA